MSEQLTLDELKKASTNLGRIAEFLAERADWHLELDGFEALQEIDSAAATMTRRVDAFLDMLGLRVDLSLPVPPEQLPTSKFDSARLAKLAAFMSQLSRWFDSQVGHEVESGGERYIGDIHKTLQTIRRGVEPIVDASPFRDSVPDQHPPSDTENGPAHTPGGETSSRPPGGRIVTESRRLVGDGGVAAVDRLILDDNDEHPVTQTFRNEVELADSTKEDITNFLQKHDVQYSGYQLRKFQDEVLRRVVGTPDGQVLVLKIGGFQDSPKPFFNYVPKLTEDISTGGPVTVENPYLGAPLPESEEAAGGSAGAEGAGSPAAEAATAEGEAAAEPAPAAEPEEPAENDELFFDDSKLE